MQHDVRNIKNSVSVFPFLFHPFFCLTSSILFCRYFLYFPFLFHNQYVVFCSKEVLINITVHYIMHVLISPLNAKLWTVWGCIGRNSN